jgi:hypothetical protein
MSFRFFFLLFGLFLFPFPLSVIPGIDIIMEPYNNFLTWLIGLVGNGMLGIEDELKMKVTGSGDQLYDWVMYGMFLGMAVIGALIWTILDRKRKAYQQLQQWFLVILAYYLAHYMFVYGIIKLFYLQFGPPNMERLFQDMGQISPMRLLWTFMGFSKTYVVFSGLSETIAGVLLLFRRTRTLGGLVAFGVMLNVFMMNMSYDVPVKLFSFQLMIMGLYIALIDYRRLINFFLKDQTAGPSLHRPLFDKAPAKYILLGAQILLAGYLIISQVFGAKDAQARYGAERPKPPLHGIYEVQTFVQNQDTIPPLLTDTVRWRYLLVDYVNFTTVLRINGKSQRYQSTIDTVEQSFTFNQFQDTVNKYVLHYELEEKDMHLQGIMEGDTLQIELKHIPKDNFGLLNRGFNWVNEVPYNRYNYPK